ncbi:hypothetical protein AB0J86_28295 [Micromonospora sp. NPDC049559]|uniref:hypothetical protein n=1 Tax=Micromonospora sp. NPDC049559 TaxID=3155923 RepID=UPI00343DB44E
MSERISQLDAWAVVVPDGRYEAERLFHHETLELPDVERVRRPAPGDPVLVVTGDDPPLAVALGRVAPAAPEEHDPDDPQSENGTAPLVVTYTRRAFDEPVPAERLALAGPVTPVDPALYRELADRIGPPPHVDRWMVSLDLPIEASSPAEAVRLFWSYVMELGPRELPAFVSPADDELAMQAFVLGAEANQDPEEDDD